MSLSLLRNDWGFQPAKEASLITPERTMVLNMLLRLKENQFQHNDLKSKKPKSNLRTSRLIVESTIEAVEHIGVCLSRRVEPRRL